MRVRVWWLPAGVLVLSVWACAAACGGDDGGDGEPSATVAATATAAPDEAVARAATLCAAPAQPVSSTVVAVAELVETSGLAASRRNEGVLWGNNDSGDSARVIAFDVTGAARGVYDIAGAEAIDWEDMALGPGPHGEDYLYLGDIGDNSAERAEIVVYRALEPDVGEGASGGVINGAEALALRYPDTPHDAETLLVDPRSGSLIIVTKELITGNAGVYEASAALLDAGGGTLVNIGEIEKARLTPADTPPDDAGPLVRGVGYLPTGGDISADGSLIALRTYATVWLFARAEDASIADAFAGAACEAPSAVEPQGEALAFDANSTGYFTISEGANPPLHYFGGE
jgi:hypothetical protein